MALAGTVFCISGSLSISKSQMTAKLASAGATVASSLTAKVSYLLSTAADVSKKTSKTVAAQTKGLPIVSEAFVDACLAKGNLVAVKPYLLTDGGAAQTTAAAPKKQKKRAAAADSKSTTAKKKKSRGAYMPVPAAPEPLADGMTVVTDDQEQFLEFQLSQMDIAKNVDKFYVAQVLEAAGGQFHCAQHWGRTGTAGQRNIDGPYPGVEFAVEAFEQKFKEKTGAAYAQRDKIKPKKGKYRYKRVNYARSNEGAIMWQYWVDDGVDGKATGWYDYVPAASEGVDAVFVEWESNPWLDVRCIASGNWSYRVDFNTSTQTNVSTNKTRKIRRTVDGVG